MIVKLKEVRENTPRRERDWNPHYSTARIARPSPLKVEFRQIAYALPFLFLAGVFTGIAIMLMTKG